MHVVSIDIGSRNLGVSRWLDVDDRCDLIDSGRLVQCTTLDPLQEAYGDRPVPKTYTQHQAAEAATFSLLKILDSEPPVDRVFIEVQGAQMQNIGGRKVLRQSKNRPIGHNLHGMFVTQNRECKVKWVSAKSKEGVYERLQEKSRYRQRKDTAVEVGFEYLDEFYPDIAAHVRSLKKWDDALDSLLQGIGSGYKPRQKGPPKRKLTKDEKAAERAQKRAMKGSDELPRFHAEAVLGNEHVDDVIEQFCASHPASPERNNVE